MILPLRSPFCRRIRISSRCPNRLPLPRCRCILSGCRAGRCRGRSRCRCRPGRRRAVRAMAALGGRAGAALLRRRPLPGLGAGPRRYRYKEKWVSGSPPRGRLCPPLPTPRTALHPLFSRSPSCSPLQPLSPPPLLCSSFHRSPAVPSSLSPISPPHSGYASAAPCSISLLPLMPLLSLFHTSLHPLYVPISPQPLCNCTLLIASFACLIAPYSTPSPVAPVILLRMQTFPSLHAHPVSPAPFSHS